MPDRARDNTFQNRPTLIIQKMDFVDNDKAHEIRVARVRALACDDIPFLRRCDDDLRLGDLLLGHLRVTSKLSDFDAEGIETFVEVSDHFLCEGFYRCDVYDLEIIESKFARCFITVFGHFIEDGKDGSISLQNTS
jgi:hypothetical protein